MRVVLATGNPGKLRELRSLLQPLAAEVLPRADFCREDVAETGLTFVENALIKARHAAKVSGLPAIADDSGLEVDALHGAPGIYSARYAGEGAGDDDNLQKLLHDMRDVPDSKRTARYRCVLVFMRWAEDPFPIVCSASWQGRIGREPRGAGGFGYDPVFWLDELGITAAELDAAEKNRLSHRGRALRGLLAALIEARHLHD